MSIIKGFIKEFFKTIIFSIIFALIITDFIFLPAKIDGRSMEPNLLDRSYVLLGRFTLYNGIDRFNIVAIDNGDYYLIKRVIALPNEKIQYKNNQLYINDILVEHDFKVNGNTADFTYQLKDDEYFCIGDNREHSTDSRTYGPFSKKQIKSESILIKLGGIEYN